MLGSGLADVIPARGAAFGDLFNDGKIDVVINCLDHTPVLLRNVNDDHNHWVGLLLTGGAKSPRDAVGSTIYVTAGGMRQRGDVMSGGSFESSNDFRLQFGLGAATAWTRSRSAGPMANARRSRCRQALIAITKSKRVRALFPACSTALPLRCLPRRTARTQGNRHGRNGGNSISREFV